MSDGPPDLNAALPAAEPQTAGTMLRRARQAQGLHIAALAAAIKVTPRKLELLESDQYDQLTDATFVRALAQTVCRSLKMDAAPVLAMLPPPSGSRLGQVEHALNTPFRERPGRIVPNDWASLASPGVWLAGLVVLAAIAVYWMPAGWLTPSRSRPVGSPAAGDTSASGVASTGGAASTVPAGSDLPARVAAPVAASTPAVDPSASAPVAATSGAFPPTVADSGEESAAGAEMLQLRTTAQSWIEVSDAKGQSLISRLVEAGESVGVDGAPPLKLKIGNARATAVVFRGKAVELNASTHDNVARLELK